MNAGDIMLKTSDIIDEKNKILRKKSVDVTFPMTEEDKKNIDLMVEYLHNSQIDELCGKYNLRPGMGMSAVQIGVLKRYITIVHEYEEGKFNTYVVINPKIVSESKEKIYVEDGEGCLSINRETIGIVPRCARVTVEGFDIDGNPIKIRAREELAIVFQHEIDHLNGILFIDHIDPKNPFKGKDKYRSI
jgi:peptide deformylase